MKTRLLKVLHFATNILLAWMILPTLGLLARVARRMRRGTALWLIAERSDEARDNGYHLYKHIKTRRPEIDVAYVISSHSADLEKVKNLGAYVEYGSLRHYWLYAICDVALSTHFHGAAPLGAAGASTLRLLPRKLTVFLRHGIGQAHFSTFEGVFQSKTRTLMICGAKPEYEYYRSHNTGQKCTLAYTGFARFDALNTPCNVKRQILYMPTFRKWIFDLTRLPKPEALDSFKRQRYYQKVNELLSSSRLHEILERSNVSLVFYPHYRMHDFLEVFEPGSSRIVVAGRKEYDIQRLLKESSALVTDFSSVFFDFAYLGKPTVYYQFDQRDYEAKHYKPGYFDCQAHGFGPVRTDANGVVDEIEALVKADFQMPETYANRVSAFFTMRDSENCERILQAVERLL